MFTTERDGATLYRVVYNDGPIGSTAWTLYDEYYSYEMAERTATNLRKLERKGAK